MIPSRLKSRAGAIGLKISQKYGIRCGLKTVAGTTVPVWMLVYGDEHKTSTLRSVADMETCTADLPLQSGFDPSTLETGALIELPYQSSCWFSIEDVSPDNGTLSNSATFQLSLCRNMAGML